MTNSSKEPFFVRIPVNVGIKDAKTGEMIFRTSSTKKSQIRARCQSFPRQNANSGWVGYGKITYNAEGSYWNKFEFRTYQELDQNLATCTEKEMLLEMVKDGSLDKRYLEKRKAKPLTDEQKEKLKAGRIKLAEWRLRNKK